MLGVHERRNRNTVSMGSMATAQLRADAATDTAAAPAEERSGMAVIGEVELLRLFNDGGKCVI